MIFIAHQKTTSYYPTYTGDWSGCSALSPQRVYCKLLEDPNPQPSLSYKTHTHTHARSRTIFKSPLKVFALFRVRATTRTHRHRHGPEQKQRVHRMQKAERMFCVHTHTRTQTNRHKHTHTSAAPFSTNRPTSRSATRYRERLKEGDLFRPVTVRHSCIPVNRSRNVRCVCVVVVFPHSHLTVVFECVCVIVRACSWCPSGCPRKSGNYHSELDSQRLLLHSKVQPPSTN